MIKFLKWLPIIFLLGGCVVSHGGKSAGVGRVNVRDIFIEAPDSRLPGYEKLTYQVRWLGIPVGTLTTSINGLKNFNGRDAYVLEATMKTNAFLSMIYKVNDRFVSYMDVEKVCSLRHEAYIREGHYKKQAVIDFDEVNHTAHFKNFLNNYEKNFEIPPGVQDVLTAYYYLMLLPVKLGDRVEYNVCNNESNYKLFGVVQSKAFVNVPAFGNKQQQTFLIRLQPGITVKGQKLEKGNMDAYFSCGKNRIPLYAVLEGPIFTEITVSLDKIENK